VSSLAGVLPTRDRGLIWFAIINVGDGDLGVLHQQQDLLLQSLTQQWGAGSYREITPSDRASQSDKQLGAASRNQIL
jgi:serine-type D-Ala-D-Ala carboxypeptidase/endopeptidase (penicillin-binding protein 4)